ncbi:ATP-binding protein [Streptomyces sp. NPDC005811]|uniref:ATP-binding protein n=1 Tax=Streptomyces sp. NPDC005811 TaxID=3154565 RepID=UPI00340C6EFF
MSHLRAPVARADRREGGRHGRPVARTAPVPAETHLRPQLLRLAVLPPTAVALSACAVVLFTVRSTGTRPGPVLWAVLAGAVAVTGVGILVAAVAADRAARSVSDRVAALRRSSARGEADLRALVESLRRGEVPERRKSRGGPPGDADDFELLAADLARAHSGAVTAVVQASQLSSQAGSEQKLEVFVNLARRLQSLVHREISILDELENEIEDPELLKGLFHVDHLATRIRRHAENLAVLGGAVSRRQWSNPVSMTEVLRSAIAEVEQYSRVKLVPPIDGELRGHAVADVIHLLAELVENATVFSAPHTQVLLRATLCTSGLAVEVEDRGLGMPVEEQARMNALLADPDQVNVGRLLADGRIGLYVVSQLARRHGIRVRLQSNIYGGVQAVLVVPQALLGGAAGADVVPARDPLAPTPAPEPVPAADHRQAPATHATASRQLPRQGSDTGRGPAGPGAGAVPQPTPSRGQGMTPRRPGPPQGEDTGGWERLPVPPRSQNAGGGAGLPPVSPEELGAGGAGRSPVSPQELGAGGAGLPPVSPWQQDTGGAGRPPVSPQDLGTGGAGRPPVSPQDLGAGGAGLPPVSPRRQDTGGAGRPPVSPQELGAGGAGLPPVSPRHQDTSGAGRPPGHPQPPRSTRGTERPPVPPQSQDADATTGRPLSAPHHPPITPETDGSRVPTRLHGGAGAGTGAPAAGGSAAPTPSSEAASEHGRDSGSLGGPGPLPVRGERHDRPNPAEAVPGIRRADRRVVEENAGIAPVPRSGPVRGTLGKPQLPRRRAQEHIVPQLRGGPAPRPDVEQPAGHDPGLMAAFQRGIGLAEAQQSLEAEVLQSAVPLPEWEALERSAYPAPGPFDQPRTPTPDSPAAPPHRSAATGSPVAAPGGQAGPPQGSATTPDRFAAPSHRTATGAPATAPGPPPVASPHQPAATPASPPGGPSRIAEVSSAHASGAPRAYGARDWLAGAGQASDPGSDHPTPRHDGSAPAG